MAKVLVVEDDERVRVLAESILKDAGHEVCAATGVDGSTAILDSDHPLDVLFIDLSLGNDLEAGAAGCSACARMSAETRRPLHHRSRRE